MNISVIIPSYQHSATIGRCLDSILSQTLKPDEIIVVNDGSTDNTLKVLEIYQDQIILINQENKGSNPARNVGFKASKGDRIVFCDADVIMAPNMIKELNTALDSHSEASYAYSGFRFGWKSFRSYPFDSERLRQINFIHTTTLIRREHFPGFDPKIKRLQDWDVWLSMLDQGHVGIFVDQQLFKTIDDNKRIGISEWRPSIMYRIPWKKIGWIPKSMRKYKEARRILSEKHKLQG